jgi:hypothetical protein
MPNQPGDAVDTNDVLYRRFLYYKKPGVHSRSFVLRPQDEGKASVDAASLTDPLTSVKDTTKYSLVEINNSDVIAIQNNLHQPLQSIHDPISDGKNDNPAHCLIFNIPEDDDITPALLAAKARKVNFDSNHSS